MFLRSAQHLIELFHSTDSCKHTDSFRNKIRFIGESLNYSLNQFIQKQQLKQEQNSYCMFLRNAQWLIQLCLELFSLTEQN